MARSKIRDDSGFIWDERRSNAAMMLAIGKTQIQAAAAAEVSDRTIRTWMQSPEFSAEVDRLTLMMDIATRAERLRIVMRVVRQSIDEQGNISTKYDVLDWLRFAQSETDGSKNDIIGQLAALYANSVGEK